MAIAIRGTPTTATSTAANASITTPTGAVANDILLWTLNVEGVSNVATPSGWTAVTGSPLTLNTGGTAISYHYAWYQVLTGSAAASYHATFAANNSQQIMVAFSGANTSTPTDGTNHNSNGSGVTSFQSGSVTTTQANDVIVTFTANDLPATPTYPTGNTNPTTALQSGAEAVSFCWISEASTGTYNPSWSDSGSDWTGFTIALQPAAAGGTSWNQSLADAFSALDVRVSQVNKPFKDALSALDAVTKLYQAVKTDAFSETDASTHSATKPFTEAISETDASTRTTGKNLGDATSATDHTGPFGVNKPLGDVTSALDLLAKLVAKAPITEFISETDSITRFRSFFQTILDAFSEKDALGPKTVQKALADATSALDALTKLVTTLRTDAFSLVDALSKIPAKALLDAFAETDSLNAFKPSGTAWNQTLTDKHSALDVVVKQITKVNSDAISALDTFARTWVAHLLFTEMFSETDATQKALLRTIQDTQVAQDIVQKLVQHTIVEAMSATDSQTRQTLHLVADAISALDSRTTSVRKVLFDTLSATDKATAGKLLLLTLLDAFSVLDSAGQPLLTHPVAAKKITIAAGIVSSLLNITVTLAIGSGLALLVTVTASGLTITATLQ